MSARKVLFVINNNDACFDAVAPIVAVLRATIPDVRSIALSATEFFNEIQSDLDLLDSVFDETHVLASMLGYVMLRRILDDRKSPELLEAANRVLNRYLDAIDPAAIVVVNDRLFPELNIVDLANQRGIPSVLIQESIRKDQGFHHANVKHGQGGCTRIAAWGANGVEYFSGVGVARDVIHVTGSPRIDKFLGACRQVDPEAIRRSLDIPDGAHVVLFATNHLAKLQLVPFNEYSQALVTVVDLINQFGAVTGDLFVIVKPHRQERADFYRLGYDQFLSRNECARYCPNMVLADALAVSDSVLVFNSTVAVEAALLGKPVGIANLHNWDLVTDFADRGVARELTTTAALISFLNDPLANSGEIVANAQHYVTHIGQAADNVAREIMELMEQKALVGSVK